MAECCEVSVSLENRSPYLNESRPWLSFYGAHALSFRHPFSVPSSPAPVPSLLQEFAPTWGKGQTPCPQSSSASVVRLVLIVDPGDKQRSGVTSPYCFPRGPTWYGPAPVMPDQHRTPERTEQKSGQLNLLCAGLLVCSEPAKGV